MVRSNSHRPRRRVWTRKAHRWGALAVAFPFLLVLTTGLLLQLRKQLAWVQPPSARGAANVPIATLGAILEAAKSVPEASVTDWSDVVRIDIQPTSGIAKVQARNRWEVQIDLQTAQVLRVAYRRSDLIKSLHDGSWFHEAARVWFFFPVGLVVLGMWFSGVYLFAFLYWTRWRRRRKRAGQHSGA